MNAYFTDPKRTKRNIPHINFTHGFIEFICSIVAFFTCDVVATTIKIIVCAISFITFFGVIGGIDAGTITMARGLFICSILSTIEFFTLKSVTAKDNKKDTK